MMMKGMLKGIFSPRDVDPHFIENVPPSLMLRPWQIKAGAEDSAFMMPAAADLARHYEEISQPVEIFVGTEDKLVKPSKQSVRLNKIIPNSRLHLMTGEGHMLHYRRSREIVDAIDLIAGVGGLSRATAANPDSTGRDAANEASAAFRSAS
jgi:pimeloyl-ACP methyl ester carboxylesterase